MIKKSLIYLSLLIVILNISPVFGMGPTGVNDCDFSNEEKENIAIYISMNDFGNIGKQFGYPSKFECDENFSAYVEQWKDNCKKNNGIVETCSSDNPDVNDKSFCCNAQKTESTKPTESKSNLREASARLSAQMAPAVIQAVDDALGKEFNENIEKINSAISGGVKVGSQIDVGDAVRVAGVSRELRRWEKACEESSKPANAKKLTVFRVGGNETSPRMCVVESCEKEYNVSSDKLSCVQKQENKDNKKENNTNQSSQTYKQQGPFPKEPENCYNGSFNLYKKPASDDIKKANETEFKEWKTACLGLASCKNAQEMTWIEDSGNLAISYSCVPKTCLPEYPNKHTYGCGVFSEGADCTPADENASTGKWDAEAKTCRATECKKSRKYELIDGKCVAKKDINTDDCSKRGGTYKVGQCWCDIKILKAGESCNKEEKEAEKKAKKACKDRDGKYQDGKCMCGNSELQENEKCPKVDTDQQKKAEIDNFKTDAEKIEKAFNSVVEKITKECENGNKIIEDGECKEREQNLTDL